MNKMLKGKNCELGGQDSKHMHNGHPQRRAYSAGSQLELSLGDMKEFCVTGQNQASKVLQWIRAFAPSLMT